jgi:hypothetical protein
MKEVRSDLFKLSNEKDKVNRNNFEWKSRRNYVIEMLRREIQRQLNRDRRNVSEILNKLNKWNVLKFERQNNQKIWMLKPKYKRWKFAKKRNDRKDQRMYATSRKNKKHSNC